VTTFDRYLPSGLALFVRSWVQDPRAVGAVAPSGRRLAALMTSAIAPDARVIELGPGTGSFTRAILARGIDPRRLGLIELSGTFAARLQRDLPDVTVVCGDATAQHPLLESFVSRTDIVVSGLPLVLFARQEKAGLLRRSFELLRPSGAFFQFTYGGRCPVSRRQLDEMGLEATRVGITVFNLPPAFVYRIARKSP
jgi:phosphatidylethanolamine/phosphatidyl-N-methylethanolamine N-methyltransferase